MPEAHVAACGLLNRPAPPLSPEEQRVLHRADAVRTFFKALDLYVVAVDDRFLVLPADGGSDDTTPRTWAEIDALVDDVERLGFASSLDALSLTLVHRPELRRKFRIHFVGVDGAV